MLEALRNRLKLLFSIGVATRVKTGWVQVKLATGIVNDRIKRIHNYGVMSRPLPGAKGYILFMGGDTSRGVAFCIEDERYQMELEPGDVAVLDYRGNLIHLKDNGVRINTPNTLTIDANKVVINSDTTINGKVTNTGGISIDGIDFGTHTHNENGDGGGTTSQPNNQ